MLLVLAPLGIVGVLAWAGLRAVKLIMRPRPEDGVLTEYLLSQPHFKSVYWDPHLLERAKNLHLTKEAIEQAIEEADADDNDEEPAEQPDKKEPS